jgi:hypothetical protein
MKFLIATAFSLPFAVISNTATAKNLTCTGVLARNNGELQLMPDPGSALWCDASFEGEKWQVTKAKIVKQITAACSEGERCRVVGEVQGHGVFYWVKITAVRKISSDQPQTDSYKHLIGTESEGPLVIADWNNQGGGLLDSPVWYALYERNGAYLVLTEWALPRKPDATHSPFRVTDVLLISTLEERLRLVFECQPPRTNVFEKVFAVVRVDSRTSPDRLRDVRKAWKVDLGSGTISPIPTVGIICSIPAG